MVGEKTLLCYVAEAALYRIKPPHDYGDEEVSRAGDDVASPLLRLGCMPQFFCHDQLASIDVIFE